MKRLLPWAGALLLVLAFGCSKGSGNASGGRTGDTRMESAKGISYRVPTDWTSAPPSSGMRAAQYTLPVASGETDAPELVLYFFGEGQGGSAQANIDRWMGQFTQSNGSSASDQAKTSSRTVGPFKVTEVRVSGTYAGGMGMGQAENKPGYAMWGAVIEGQGGPWFFKAVGPVKSMQRIDAQFDDVIDSLVPAKS